MHESLYTSKIYITLKRNEQEKGNTRVAFSRKIRISFTPPFFKEYINNRIFLCEMPLDLIMVCRNNTLPKLELIDNIYFDELNRFLVNFAILVK